MFTNKIPLFLTCTLNKFCIIVPVYVETDLAHHPVGVLVLVCPELLLITTIYGSCQEIRVQSQNSKI